MTAKPQPKWCKRDYELVAGIIKRQYDNFASHGSAEANTILACTMTAFIQAFLDDNPAFDLERFHTACGFKEHKE